VAGKNSKMPLEGDGQSSFFFTNFPEDYKAKDMWNVSRRYGKISELFIPGKRDKRGEQFGFVRFENVLDARMLALKMDKTFKGDSKLMVNLPKFSREEWPKVRFAEGQRMVYNNKKAEGFGNGVNQV